MFDDAKVRRQDATEEARMRRFHRRRIALAGAATLMIGAALVAPMAPANAAPGREDGLPLGAAGLPQTVSVEDVLPGVTLITYVRGNASAGDFWYVRAGFVATRDAADSLAARLVAAGYAAEVEEIDGRPVDDPVRGPSGYLVRVGHFVGQAEAAGLAQQLSAAGFAGLAVTNTALNGGPTTGPWVVSVLRVDRRFAGKVSDELSNGVVQDRETTSSMVTRLGAVAGVNGGYFVIGSADGTPGSPAGVSVLDGSVVREANGRAALILQPGAAPRITRLDSALSVRSSDGATRVLNGIDRSVGVIRDCGEPGDVPTTLTQQDITCTNPNELVAFDATYGPRAESGTGVEAVLDAHGVVEQLLGSRGGTVPAGGRIVEGIGTGADWLRAHAAAGTRLWLHESVTDVRGAAVALTRGTDVVGGGPYLVRDGREFVDAFTEGFEHPGDPSFYYAFGISRNPRTMAGVTGDGDLLLVTVDGRQPGYSVGLSFPEEARLMRALGAVHAVNLDGGGSTTMVVRDKVLGQPSDATGERPVGDAILIFGRTPSGTGG
jgi:exopolysaccharide biosynthesis protein